MPYKLYRETCAEIMTSLWSRFESEYFTHLRQERDSGKKPFDVEVGKLVHVLDKSNVTGYYKLGRVTEVFPSGDGINRRYKIILGTGEEIERSYHHISPLNILGN